MPLPTRRAICRLIAFVRSQIGRPGGARSLWVVHRNGRAPRQLASITGCCATQPSWSPDGKRIAYASQGDVFVADVASGRAANLTASKNVDDSDPAWSPDGRLIAWLRGDNIHLMRPDGTAKLRVTYIRARHKGRPVWSLNTGQPRLAFHVGLRLGQNSDVYVSTRGATHPQPITRTARHHETDPVWSPDGDWIAFTRVMPDTGCCGELWIARPDGRHQRRLGKHAGHASWGSLSTEQRRLGQRP